MDNKAQIQDLENQIKDILRIAGVKFVNQIQDKEQKEKARALSNQVYVLRAPKVKDLIADLQKYDPEAIVIISEKWGRGGAQYSIANGYTDNYMEQCSPEKDESYKYPAVEVSCAF